MVPLPSDGPEGEDKIPEAARIVAEICERLDELDAIRPNTAIRLISRLAILANESEHAFRLTVQLMHGNTAMLSAFKRIDPDRGVSRQAASQRLTRSIRFLRSYSAPLAAYVQQIRDMRKHKEDPNHTRNTTASGAVRTFEHSRSNAGE